MEMVLNEISSIWWPTGFISAPSHDDFIEFQAAKRWIVANKMSGLKWFSIQMLSDAATPCILFKSWHFLCWKNYSHHHPNEK